MVGGCCGRNLLLRSCTTTDHFVLTTSSRLNSCDGVGGHPLALRILSLGSTTEFEKRDFFELWEDLEEALGDELLAVEETTMIPDRRSGLDLERPEAATAIGILANFCSPGDKESCWRQVVPLRGGAKTVKIYFDETCMVLE
jgi:type VI secretion system VasD/TssJ family lipoprotein